jgi:hypothetical protein
MSRHAKFNARFNATLFNTVQHLKQCLANTAKATTANIIDSGTLMPPMLQNRPRPRQ